MRYPKVPSYSIGNITLYDRHAISTWSVSPLGGDGGGGGGSRGGGAEYWRVACAAAAVDGAGPGDGLCFGALYGDGDGDGVGEGDGDGAVALALAAAEPAEWSGNCEWP